MRIACYIPCASTYSQVQSALATAGLECCHFPHEEALLIACRRRRFELILVDTEQFNASLMAAWLGCRTGENTPLVLISPSCGPDEVAHALDSGVEDFIRRPFAPVELLARVQAVLRRHDKTDCRQFLELRGFLLNRAAGALFDRGMKVVLTPREFSLAWLFFSTAGTYLSRDTLSAAVWGVDQEISKHTIEQHVYLLRKKLKLSAARGIQLRTAYNKGYRLELVDELMAPEIPNAAASPLDVTVTSPPDPASVALQTAKAGRELHLATLPMQPGLAMSRHFERCAESCCSRPFQINRFNGTSCEWIGAGSIACPHCGASTPADAGFVYLTHALSTDDEARYDEPDHTEPGAQQS